MPGIAVTPARQAVSPTQLIDVGILGRVFMALRAAGLAPVMVRAVLDCVLAVAAGGVVPEVGQGDVRAVSVIVTDLHAIRTRAEEGFGDKNVDGTHNVMTCSGKTDDRVAVPVKRKLEDADAGPGARTGKAADSTEIGYLIESFVADNGKPAFNREHTLILRRILGLCHWRTAQVACHWFTGDDVLGPEHLATPCKARDDALMREWRARG